MFTFRGSSHRLSLFLSLSKEERHFFSSLFHQSLGILVDRNEGFLLLKGKETELTLHISRNNSSEVDWLQQQGSLWSERIMERPLLISCGPDTFFVCFPVAS